MNKVLVLGGSGLVGSRFVDLQATQFEIVAPSHHDFDVTDFNHVGQKIEELRPDVVLYAAGFTDVDLAEEKVNETYALNVKAPEIITQKVSQLQIPFYYLSTDYVFNGSKTSAPYTEEDIPDPVDSVYAKSKRDGEKVVLHVSPFNGVIRLIMPFSAVYSKKGDLARVLLERLKNGQTINGVIDQKINPIFVDDLCRGIGKILEKKSSGIYHLGATDFTTPYDFVMALAAEFGLSTDHIKKTTFAEFSETRQAPRPQNTWLDTSKFREEFGTGILQTIKEEIDNFKVQVDSLS